jgi:hypothetical protein
MWDTGAPNLHRLGAYLAKPGDPFNAWEPVDSSAAAIAAQGFVRLGNCLLARGDEKNGDRYRQAGLTMADILFDEPYLSTNLKHQGLLLHSVYHRPNGWDYVAPGQKVPGEFHVGRLPRPRTGAPALARGMLRTVSHLLRRERMRLVSLPV